MQPESRHDREPLVEGIVEAVHDGDDHVVRRLLARFAEQATVPDLLQLCRLCEELPERHPADAPPH